MKQLLLCITFLISTSYASAQIINRVEVKGKIIVEINEIEGVVVYNVSSNKRILTDNKGEFNIDVALNDRIEISALQFETFTVLIDESIISSKHLTAFLVERVNKLDEVVILPFGLTGNLITDLDKLRTFNPDLDAIYFGVADLDAYQYTEPQYQEVENMILKKDQFYNGVDFVKITNWLIKPRFKSKNKSDNKEFSSYSDLHDMYTRGFISTNFDIPEDQVNEFIAFAETNNVDKSLYDTGKDIQLIEYLVNQSKLFLNTENNRE